MDDIAAKLSELLQDPKSVEQLKSLAGAFIGSNEAEEEPAAPASVPAAVESESPGVDMIALMKVASALQSMNQETDHTRLLLALKPYLSEERQQKVDSALRILRLLELLPMIKESGII